MKMAKSMLNLFCIIALIGSTGCIPLVLGAAAGASGVVYVKGTLEKNVDEPVKEVHKATLNAMKSLGLLVTNDDIERHSAKVVAQFEDEKKVTVTIKALTEKASSLRVRVGLIGDETRSMNVMNAIENQL